MMKKKYVRFLIILLSLIIVYFVTLKLLFVNAEYTCGVFVGKTEIRGSKYYTFSYKVNNNTYFGQVSISGDGISLEKLKELKCVRIKYSKWIYSFAIPEDSRIEVKE